jgi:glycosyltransferase involved in cell wall biosynthesis
MVQHGFRVNNILRNAGIMPESLQVIYSPFFDALFSCSKVPQLITCHDLTPLTYPNSCKAWLKYRFWQPRHLALASQTIAISRHVANQLINFGYPQDRIVVVPNGICMSNSPVLFPQSEDLLVIARHDVNKNLRGIIQALGIAQRLLPHWNGVMRIIGRGVATARDLHVLRKDLPKPENLLLLNALGPVQLKALTRNSLALVSASLEEGFDYPVMEAKSEGIPTLLSEIPVHKEFHLESSLFFPVHDDGSVFTFQLSRLLGDNLLWSDLSQAGRDLAQSLSIEVQQEEIRRLIDQFN